MFKLRFAILILLALSVAAPAQAASPDTFKRLLEAAKKDKELVLWSNSPDQEVTPILVEAFNKRFGLKIQVHQVPMGTDSFTSRLVTGAQAGKIEADLGQGAPDTVFLMLGTGLLEDFDWTGVFGQEFPDIKKRVERVIPAFQRKVLDYWHLAYGIAYRTDRVKESEVPKTWAGLADPRWKGQVALIQQGFPFNNFAPFWGMERVLELARKLKSNQPIFGQGSRGAAALVEAGEATLGVSTIGQIEFRKSQGVPIDWVTPDEIPIAIEHLIIPKGAPHLNLARLWAAWITTEGRPLHEKLTKDGMVWPDENSFLAARMKRYGTKYRFVESKEQAQMTDEARRKVSGVYLGK